jgi:nitrous oxidase accessory protein NosD
MIELAAAWLLLHGLDGRVVTVNPPQIVLLRSPGRPHRGHYHQGVHCLVYTADGKHAAVVESCDDIRRMTGEVAP